MPEEVPKKLSAELPQQPARTKSPWDRLAAEPVLVPVAKLFLVERWRTSVEHDVPRWLCSNAQDNVEAKEQEDKVIAEHYDDKRDEEDPEGMETARVQRPSSEGQELPRFKGAKLEHREMSC